MKVWYDLHIHSALSPCADNDMTPNNIVNMAVLKGLDAIAVCDHNCAANVRAVAHAAERAGICFVPGIELNTAEEVHLLVFFEDVAQAEAFGGQMYGALPDIKNNTEFFGNQYILDENDEITGEKEKLLISALPYSMEECCGMAQEYGGVPVPAHVNKEANSILANLGFFPPQELFRTVEVIKDAPVAADVPDYRVIHNSDAHALWQIAEKTNAMELGEKTRACILKTLNYRNHA